MTEIRYLKSRVFFDVDGEVEERKEFVCQECGTKFDSPKGIFFSSTEETIFVCSKCQFPDQEEAKFEFNSETKFKAAENIVVNKPWVIDLRTEKRND